MNILKDFLFVALGGALGSALRYGASVFYRTFFTGMFPYSTLFVNSVGSFLIGYLAVSFSGAHNNCWRLFLIVGLLGGFTTFSAFSHETLVLFNNNQPFQALLNVAANLVFCLLFVFLGFKIALMKQ